MNLNLQSGRRTKSSRPHKLIIDKDWLAPLFPSAARFASPHCSGSVFISLRNLPLSPSPPPPLQESSRSARKCVFFDDRHYYNARWVRKAAVYPPPKRPRLSGEMTHLKMQRIHPRRTQSQSFPSVKYSIAAGRPEKRKSTKANAGTHNLTPPLCWKSPPFNRPPGRPRTSISEKNARVHFPSLRRGFLNPRLNSSRFFLPPPYLLSQSKKSDPLTCSLNITLSFWLSLFPSTGPLAPYLWTIFPAQRNFPWTRRTSPFPGVYRRLIKWHRYTDPLGLGKGHAFWWEKKMEFFFVNLCVFLGLFRVGKSMRSTVTTPDACRPNAFTYCELPIITSLSEEPYPAFPGEELKVPCQAYGSPAPVIAWYRVLANGESIDVPSSATGSHMMINEAGVLRIRHVVPHDDGKYFCMASNSVGESKMLIEIKVRVLEVLFFPGLSCTGFVLGLTAS